jgi:hypothetical protein
LYAGSPTSVDPPAARHDSDDADVLADLGEKRLKWRVSGLLTSAA